VVVAWLVFSVLKKLMAVALLAAAALAGFVLWQNPTLLNALISWLRQVAG
jgi:hypothetical protein